MKKYFKLALIFILSSQLIYTDDTNLNDYYRYPVSFGIGYSSQQSINASRSGFSINGLTGTVRMPLPSVPVLQPTFQAGSLLFRSDTAGAEWEHDRWFAAGGLSITNRFSKAFELGGELLGGYEYAIFNRLAEGPRGVGSVLLQAGGRISVSPSFNLNLEFHPHLRYSWSTKDYFRDFDGLSLGLGFSVNWRIGQDPDAPGAVIRSLRFSEVTVATVFAAMQSFYLNNPIGSVVVTNTDRYPVSDLTLLFHQPNFMDAPSSSAVIDILNPGQSKQIDLYAVFNQEIFLTEGITPLSGDIIASYHSRRRPVEQRFPVSFELRDKTAIVWDDDRKAAALVTPSDSAVRNYASFIRRSGGDSVLSGLSGPLQTAMLTYHALSELGILYQLDPVSPFSLVQENPEFVDSVCLPRETLSRGAGDCDDLTVLYSAILESVGIETAFITVPGHIFPAFNTQVPARSYRSVHPDRSMVILFNGEVWVPVEVTMIGRADFLECWRIGAEQYYTYEDQPDLRDFIVVREAQEIYRPVGLRETDLGLQYGSSDEIRNNFLNDIARLGSTVTEPLRQTANQRGLKQDYNRLGVVYARFGRYQDAESALRKALSLDADYMAARFNLGNIYLITGSYREALAAFHRAETLLGASSIDAGLSDKVFSAMALCYRKMDDESAAASYVARISSTSRENQVTDGGRASSSGGPDYFDLFMEDGD